jgi:hypothetical protein
MDPLNLDILDAVQLIQHNSANKLLEYLLEKDFSSNDLKDIQLSSQSALVTGLNYQRKYIAIDSSIDVKLFITMYAKLVFEEVYRNACISMAKGELDSVKDMVAYEGTVESIYESVFTLNQLKPIIWLWKMDISDEQWKCIIGEIKKRTDEVFRMVRKVHNRSFWKKAFRRQPSIKPVHAESEPEVVLARIDSSLKKMGVKLPSNSKLCNLFYKGHTQFMEELN